MRHAPCEARDRAAQGQHYSVPLRRNAGRGPSSPAPSVHRRSKRTEHKVLRAVLGALIALCTAVVLIVHTGERRALEERGLAQLQSITTTLSDQLGPTNLAALMERYDGRDMVIKNTQDARYYVLHERLRRAAFTNQLAEPLELVAHVPVKQEVQVIVTSAEVPRFRHRWDGDQGRLLEHLEGGGHFRSGGQEHEELIVLGVIRDQGGRALGAVVARTNTAGFTSASISSLLANIGIASLLFGLAALLLYRCVGGWLRTDEEARHKMELRHDDINDSIAYAGKIQRSLVPSALLYDELFTDSFVIDRPKDVLSGDFHWVYRVDEHTCYVAAADCTGHGLPGAMMAAIGCSLLNEIVPQHAHRDPAEILAVLHTRLVATLNQEGKQRGAGDGMDVALCRVDRRAREILFAGAFRPLYWLHNGQLSVINGDRRPVGGGHVEPERRFTVHRLAYSTGDRIYLFSDGYVDQFGGPEHKRFMSSRLHGLIQENHHLSLKEQAAVLDRAFLDWKGGGEQVDDICMLGLAV